MSQCEKYSIKFIQEETFGDYSSYDLVLDSIFGFSFKGDLRAPFDKIIKVRTVIYLFQDLSALDKTKTKIISVDIPSGWDVEKGNIHSSFTPDMLVSLTLPKVGVQTYSGLHYLGGRFVPKYLFEKYNVEQPSFEGSKMILKLN